MSCDRAKGTPAHNIHPFYNTPTSKPARDSIVFLGPHEVVHLGLFKLNFCSLFVPQPDVDIFNDSVQTCLY